MKRHEFLTALGISAGTVIFAPFLTSCSKGSSALADPTPTPGGSGAVDFTLDLSLAANSVLTTNGGSLISNGVIIAKTSAGAYVAVASVCTHQGATIGYDNTNSWFHCPNHGSNFATNGSVLLGPATTALKVYSTTLTGNSLRVFA